MLFLLQLLWIKPFALFHFIIWVSISVNVRSLYTFVNSSWMKRVTARHRASTYTGQHCERTRKYIRNMSGIRNHDPGVLRTKKENAQVCVTIVFGDYGSNVKLWKKERKTVYGTWDQRFSQRCTGRFKSYGMLLPCLLVNGYRRFERS